MKKNYISPDNFQFFSSVFFLLAVLFGGAGTMLGPVIGAAVLTLLPEMLHNFDKYRLIVYGGLILLTLYFLPRGVMGLLTHKARAERQGHDRKAPLVEAFVALPRTTGAELQIEDLSRSFGGLVALSNVGFRVAGGTIHALIGPNGAGKTTLINIVSGAYRADAGRVVINGAEAKTGSLHAAARGGIVRTFQTVKMFGDMTVIEHVLVGVARQARVSLWDAAVRSRRYRIEAHHQWREARGLLSLVGISQLEQVPANNLAYGHRRLVEIARALAVRPRILLLDEPAAGLVAEEVRALAALLRKLKEAGMTILLVEHHIELVLSLSDRITRSPRCTSACSAPWRSSISPTSSRRPGAASLGERCRARSRAARLMAMISSPPRLANDRLIPSKPQSSAASSRNLRTGTARVRSPSGSMPKAFQALTAARGATPRSAAKPNAAPVFSRTPSMSGGLEWNRCSYVKDPRTGKRVARPNPREKWEITAVPQLRIVDDELWQRVKARQETLRFAIGRDTEGNALNRAHRRHFLLSGLLVCGSCGGGYTIVGPDRYGCAAHRSKGTCTNALLIGRHTLEDRVLCGLKERMMAPDLVADFVDAFNAEMRKLATSAEYETLAAKRTLAEIERKLAAIVRAIEDGAYTDTLKARLTKLEQEKAQTEARLCAGKRAPVLRLHTNLPRSRQSIRARKERRGNSGNLSFRCSAVRFLSCGV